jgi:hypothetical protein
LMKRTKNQDLVYTEDPKTCFNMAELSSIEANVSLTEKVN